MASKAKTKEPKVFTSDDLKLCGEVRDLDGIFLGSYIYVKPCEQFPNAQEFFDSMCRAWLNTYHADNRFFLVIDLETNALKATRGEILLHAISWDGKRAIVFEHGDLDLTLYKEVLNTIPIANHKVKFDLKFLMKHLGVRPTIKFCTLAQAKLGWNDAWPSMTFGLSDLCTHLLQGIRLDKSTREDFIDKDWLAHRTFQDEHIQYAARDTLVTYNLVFIVLNRLYSQKLVPLMENCEIPTMQALLDSEDYGIPIDVDFVSEQYSAIEKEAHEMLGRIQGMVSQETLDKLPKKTFNPNSPNQIVLVANSLGVRLPSTGEDILLTYYANTKLEIFKLIVDYRKHTKLLSSYVGKWLRESIEPDTHLVHPDFDIYGARTGRLSCSDPSFHNIPPSLRPAVKAKDDYSIISLDYCYDEKTEVLTDAGWKYFRDLTGKELFYSLNPDSWQVELLPSAGNVVKEYSGPMLHIRGAGVDLLTTPNHKHYVNTSWDKRRSEWRLATSLELMQEQGRVTMKRNCSPIPGELPTWISPWEDSKFLAKDWLFFLGYYIADGHCVEGNRVFISDGNRDNLMYLKKRIGDAFGPTKIVDSPTCWQLVIRSPKLAKYLEPLGHAHSKRIPSELWLLDHHLLADLYQGLMTGDGTLKKKSNQYTTVSSTLADDVQRLLLHLGLSGSISSFDRAPRVFPSGQTSAVSRTYTVSENLTRNEPTVRIPSSKGFRTNGLSWEEYTGKIYCVTLQKNHILYVRRNGKTVWSGNSQYEFRACAAYTGEQYLVDSYMERAEMLPNVLEITGKYSYRDPDDFVKDVLNPSKGLTLSPGEREIMIKFSLTDVHRRNSALVLGISTDAVSPEQRQLGKTMGYAILYGSRETEMQKQLAKNNLLYSLPECQGFREAFFKALPKVSKFVDDVRRKVIDPGYLETYLGRRRFFVLPPRYMHKLYERRLDDYHREATNFVFQGSNADATKLSIAIAHPRLKEMFDPYGDYPRIIINVHDELVLHCWSGLVEECTQTVKEIMIKAGSRSLLDKIPIEVSAKVGTCWKK